MSEVTEDVRDSVGAKTTGQKKVKQLGVHRVEEQRQAEMGGKVGPG